MAFSFGNISVDTKAKALSVENKINHILVNHYTDDDDYYLFLIEGMPKNTKLVDKIKLDIEKAGYQSYIIASATICTFEKDKVKVLKEHMKTFKSDWYSLVHYNNDVPKAIMSFGAATTAINKDSDIDASCFYDMWMNKPYYYLGSGFVGDYNTFIFPVNGVDELYPTFEDSETEPTNWKTRFFKQQLKNMKSEKIKPMDMRGYNIIVAKEP